MVKKYKYPRTYHLPYSLGSTSDDKVLSSDEHLIGKEVIITIKLDGEATTFYPDNSFHARSLDSNRSEYQSWMASFVSSIISFIPKNIRVCGEYLYAKHSIGYENLSTYFSVYSLWDGERCLSWDETEEILNNINIQLKELNYPSYYLLKTVPVIYRGIYNTNMVKTLAEKVVKEGEEGIVVRVVDSFNYEDFSKSLAKYVRKNHVQTDIHWKNKKIESNKLKKEG